MLGRSSNIRTAQSRVEFGPPSFSISKKFSNVNVVNQISSYQYLHILRKKERTISYKALHSYDGLQSSRKIISEALKQNTN